MEAAAAFLKSIWGALLTWIVVLYTVAFVWGVVDSNDWWAIPTYAVTGVLWIASLVWVLSFLFEWKNDRFILRRNLLERTPSGDADGDNAS
jgi:F0F1-type ATP synthase membrane subunit a